MGSEPTTAGSKFEASEGLDRRRPTGYLCGVFGLGFGEMVVVGLVLIVVVGPRELPKLLRGLGRGITKLRQMSADLRQQSGIDEIIEDEGLREDIEAIRSISRGRVVDNFVNAAMQPRPARRPRMAVKSIDQLTVPPGEPPERAAENPAVGPDAYGALPDDASDEEIAAAQRALDERRAESERSAVGVEGSTT